MEFNPVRFEYNENYTKSMPNTFNKVEITPIDAGSLPRKFVFPSIENVECHTARIVEVEKLKTDWREVYRMKLDKKFDFKPGDSIGILCPNNDALVDEIMEILGLKDFGCQINRTGRSPFNYTGMIRDFFKHHFDFTSLPKKSLLFNLARSCTETNRRYIEYLCSKEGTADYLGIGRGWNNTIDIIRTFECKPALEEVIGECEIVKPRYFSLINEVGRESEILVGITSKIFDRFVRYGHVSDLVIKSKTEEIGVCLRTNFLFRMDYSSRKILAICTGTGIAPFLSFVSNLQTHQTIWIIYGFRNDEDDISRLIDSSRKVKISRVKSSSGLYVGDYLMMKADEIREYIDGECIAYVCGKMGMQRQIFEIFKRKFPDVVETKRLVFDQWG
ncbi:putative oxidoreductase [Encephalitozoon cuniculi GB-M1]|uniref:Oxidoreductase n=2 Tax=Encephalitozoon cuniculi TaxID=6035 RepID=Q8STL9_ENCCU|nr:NADPH cytochrome p450 reductase [Encephalitozoon cuniculi GB-M1]AGE96322.1 putative oxidoreductase [Encephalitozoon cuniculi]KMV65352.1 NADPH cytochrome p450 reductase [Encephalitozoon cuniculi EcunIII-L]UYI26867.1 NADPH-dependent cytochrome P450 reductase [Encephalitozoon cuniculi]CAD27143.1 putative oxidoreductase [Encephalitozoon cuniculi GB-M1]